jgi:hypothetical protein
VGIEEGKGVQAMGTAKNFSNHKEMDRTPNRQDHKRISASYYN